ncbi:MAG: putative cysteine protease YraA [Elusimicrobia bacterium ADurb.Bin231]|nr:MAG: putative cysteine protease YraA [Elusimicrobia bacterium ADurb.Bin231]
MKKVVIIIAKNSFRDEEYLVPKEILQNAGVEVVTASSSIGVAYGKLGAVVNVDIILRDIDVKKFDAVIFVGGGGATSYFDDKQAHRIAVESVNNKKVLAAICVAPVILARAGALKGKKATVFSSEIKEIEKYGAVYTNKNIERDGFIITASGPSAARDFGEKILLALNEEK